MKKSLLPEKYGIAYVLNLILLGLNILLTLFFPYFTIHKAYYDSLAYIVVLVLIFLVYTWNLWRTGKKSHSDITLILFLFLLLWEVSYKVGLVHNDLLIPSPEGLFHVFVEKPGRSEATSWAPSPYCSGVSCWPWCWGRFLACWRAGWRIREVLLPISNVITLIPPMMFAAYLIMIFSTFRQAAIAVIFFAVFWPTFQGTVAKVGQIDPSIVDAARTMGVGTGGMLVKIILPFCLPEIIRSISKSLRGAFMCLSGAEMLGMNLGIGYFVEKYKAFADYRCVLAGIITVGVITTVIDVAVHKLEEIVIRWE